MKNFWALVLALVPFNSLASQEVQHAPTVEQCRADQRLWMSKLEDPNEAALVNVGSLVLLCYKLDTLIQKLRAGKESLC